MRDAGLELADDLGDEVRDVRETLRLEESRHAHRARPADAREVVAPEVDQHHVLGAVFLGREEPLGVAFARPGRAGDRVQRRGAPLGLDQGLGRGADEREAVELEQEQVRRGVHAPQRSVDVERTRGSRPLGALRKDDLERVAGADVLLGLHDRALVFVPRGQAPGRARGCATAGRVLRERAVQERGDLGRVAGQHLGHPRRVVEAHERLGDDEAALRKVASGLRERHRRLQHCGVVVAEVADDGLAAALSLVEADQARAAADEGVPP